MSYEKQTWVTGETITAEKLNHMEDGISEAGVIYVEDIFQGGDVVSRLDTTFKDIYDAFMAHKTIYVKMCSVYTEDGCVYYGRVVGVKAITEGNQGHIAISYVYRNDTEMSVMRFFANNENDYPYSD